MKLTIQEFSQRFKIPVAKLRRVECAGFLTFKPNPAETLDTIRLYLSKGQKLTSGHLRYLLLNLEHVFDLGDYAGTAQSQIAALGDVTGEAWPADKAPHVLIDQAAAGNPEYVARLAHWIAETIPANGCGYHYIAVRLLLNVREEVFDLLYRKINNAISKARQDPALAGMSATENRQTKFFQRDL